ncbi:hypothetical protein BDR07DRAFT_1419260 [Suillus spraguei]|nr:hypothetical protein BDR07DRAFT_1419260 [Suillus spraguei]
MHRCLRLNEILEIIFYFVLSNKFHDTVSYYSTTSYTSSMRLPAFLPFPRGRRSVLYLALTCRAFRELALNVLWSYIEGTEPLIMSDSVHEQVQFHPLVLRAARVQMLCLTYDIAAYALFHANAPQDGFLFPKLSSLAWYDGIPTSIPTLNLLLPTLHTLTLDISDSSFRKAILPGLPTAVQSLKSLDLVLSLKSPDSFSEIESEIESLLLNYSEGLTKLSLRCCYISNVLLDVIASWSRLRWLALWVGSERIPTALHVPQPFQALTTLFISCERLSLLTFFLRAVRRMDSDSCCFGFPNLKKIVIEAHQCDSASIWSDILTFLTHVELEHISIEGRYGQCDIPSSFALHPFFARPAALADLEILIIHTLHPITVTVSDTDIFMLARACPHLRHIDLATSGSPISLCALAYLVRRCHKLYRVAFPVDVRFETLCMAPLEDDDQVGLQPNMCLTHLSIWSSPIADLGPLGPPTAPDLMRSIPQVLHMIAPRLAGVTKLRNIGWRYDHWRRWEQVSNVLSEMVQSGQ